MDVPRENIGLTNRNGRSIMGGSLVLGIPAGELLDGFMDFLPSING